MHFFRRSPRAPGDIEAHQTGESVKRTGDVARLRNATVRRALEQAKRVPWPRLAKAADDYTDWQIFALWVRATLDAARIMPAVVRAEIDLRAPSVLRALQSKVKSAINRGDRPGAVAWEDLSCWAEMNVFLCAKREGWLDALRHFSAMSLRSMKAWSQWERMDAVWRCSAPRQLPTPQEWDRAVAMVTRLSNPGSAAQRAIDIVHSLGESDWDRLRVGFFQLNAFCQWMDLMLAVQDRTPDRLSRELLCRYPGFSLADRRIAPQDAVRSLKSWVLSHGLRGAMDAGVSAALTFHLRHHPEYAAIRSYSQFSRRMWANGSLKELPSFDDWKHGADTYSDAD